MSLLMVTTDLRDSHLKGYFHHEEEVKDLCRFLSNSGFNVLCTVHTVAFDREATVLLVEPKRR